MRQILLPLGLLLLNLPAASQQATGQACPAGAQAVFTGHPFHPLECPRPKSDSGSAQAATVPAAPAADKKLKLNDLLGGWEGYVGFGIDRFEALFSLEKDGLVSKNLLARLETREHRILLKQAFAARLKSQGPGQYAALVSLETAQLPPLNAQVSLGRSADPAFDRELLLVYPNGAAHRLRLKREKDALHYSYEDLSLPGAPASQGTFQRTRRSSL